MKKIIILFLCLAYIVEVAAQAVTINGNSTNSSTQFVDKNGQITGTAASLNKYGQILILPTLTTTAASAITFSTATSGGNISSDGGTAVTVRGVCWNTATNPTTANTKTTDGTGTGSFTSSITPLAAGTTYYIRAYATSIVGTAYGNEVSMTTLSCGANFSIQHTAGTVAPVTKTVTYGTVSTTIFGGGSKCAITQNLGADQQATSATDGTEASGGWYWQFNRKQGYKHDGSTRTPSSTWDVTSDNLNTTWEVAKDPCAIELGAGWRIPTNTEWDAANSHWGNNYTYSYTTGSYNILKIHAAGYLEYSYGSLSSRGILGYYWSNTQKTASTAYYLELQNTSMAPPIGIGKSYGLSIRCIKN